MKFSKNDGWKTKGVKRLTRLNVQRACHLAEALESQDVLYSIVIGCRSDHEMATAKAAWDGLQPSNPSQLVYKKVIINKI